LPTPDPVSVEDLLNIHDRVVNSPDGAAPGIRDAGSLEAAVARPYATFGSVEFYSTPFAKAAALMESISQRHPFVDGNKRTGLLAEAFSLDLAGYRLDVSQSEETEVAVQVAEHHLTVEDLTRWFEEHTYLSGRM